MLSSVSGFCFLTPQGRLGYYDDHGQWVPEAELSSAFGGFNLGFIHSYLREPDAARENGPVRVAVVCQPVERKKWKSATLLLETAALKSLFRVSGATPDDELTEFQKRSREMSVFRGMELLLEYRLETYPGIPIYCPVLFDRDMTLDRYAAALGRAPAETDAATPVVEVLNLLSAVPMKRRNSHAIAELIRRIHQRAVNKRVRSGPGFAVVEKAAGEHCPIDPLRRDTGAVPAPSPAAASHRTAAVPSRCPSQGADLDLPPANAAGVEKLLQPVSPELLRQFDRLRDLDGRRLALLLPYCRLYRASPGVRLLKRGARDDVTMYLVQGEVELKAGDGTRRTVVAGTPEACRPIAQLKPRLYRVKAKTPVVFLQVKDASLAQALRETSAGLGDDEDTTSQVTA
jgi:hypothetical protein